ncbi:unnamed protein product [Psylliodes chrysocephalus]|uniref:Uncharacterized protein n=1 Tax=Psylliodes chrysocephalus TaxID=3402493 RepID=A0A9P0CM04_9CUCU|nr:unnamed protein product [Psylliodes chrysocephala]
MKKDVGTKGKTDNAVTNIIKNPAKKNISSKDLAEAGPSEISRRKSIEKLSNDCDIDSESDTSIVFYTDEASDNDLEKNVRANVSFEDLQPVPRFLRSSHEKGKKTHSQVFTVTPNKIELEMKENAKLRKIELAKSRETKRKFVTDDKLKKDNSNSKRRKM